MTITISVEHVLEDRRERVRVDRTITIEKLHLIQQIARDAINEVLTEVNQKLSQKTTPPEP